VIRDQATPPEGARASSREENTRAGKRLMMALVFGILGITILVNFFAIYKAVDANISLERDDYWEAGLAQEEELSRARQADALGISAHLWPQLVGANGGPLPASSGARQARAVVDMRRLPEALQAQIDASPDAKPDLLAAFPAKLLLYRAAAPALDRSLPLSFSEKTKEGYRFEVALGELATGPWRVRVELGEPVVSAENFELHWEPTRYGPSGS